MSINNDMVIAASDSTRRFHRRVNLVPGQRIVTVHNFVNREHVKDFDPCSRHSVRESLGIADSHPVIAVVANVIPRKGQVYALRALPTILKTAPTAQLLLVGDEDQNYLRRVLSVADALNVGAHVHRPGRRRDIPELLAASDIFMLPSRSRVKPLSSMVTDSN